MTDDSRWTIHAERLPDDIRRARVSIAEVELPDGVRFEQWVLRLPKAAIEVVLNDAGENVRMMWRHRFAGATTAKDVEPQSAVLADTTTVHLRP